MWTASSHPDLVLVSCVSEKVDGPVLAKDLYMPSAWFQALRAYAESRACPWLILSAEHGALDPDRPGLTRYERLLNEESPEYRRQWAKRVLAAIDSLRLKPGIVHVLAGQAYREHVVPALKKRGWAVEEPLAYVPGLGPQKRLLRQAAATTTGNGWQQAVAQALLWTGPMRVAEALDLPRDRRPPISNGVYLVTRHVWTGCPTPASLPLYVGGNTSDTAGFRTRVGDLLADLLGFYSSDKEAAALGKASRGHHSGGQTLHNWCARNGIAPRDLFIGWATGDNWCGRCEEIALYDLWRPQHLLDCNRKLPTSCAQHGRRSSLANSPAPPASKARREPSVPIARPSRALMARITREAVLAGMDRIDREVASGVLPPGYGKHRSTGFEILLGSRSYPPKLVVAYALTHMGHPTTTSQISGGQQVNEPLRRLRFLLLPVDREGS